MSNVDGMDNYVVKLYKIIVTLFTGVVVQCRFRWLEGLYHNSFKTLGRYFLKPVFMLKYLITLFRPTLPAPHMKWLPKFINRLFFSDEPVLVNPPDLCPNGQSCQKKKCCKHIDKRVLVYINGSYTNREVFNDNLNIISNMFLLPCFGFYNPTSGLVVDTFMDSIQRFTSFNSYKTCELLNSMIKLTNTMTDVEEIVILAHGSGGLLAEQLLRLLRELKYPEVFINKFKFILVGTPVCNMKWTRDECGKLVSYTGTILHETPDGLGNKKPHKAYYKSKIYCNMCCEIDHSKNVPFPYIESIYNSGDMIASAGVGNSSRLCQSDMINVDGIRIEIPDTNGHYNYHIVDDNNNKHYYKSYLARDYNPKYIGDSSTKVF